MVGLGPESSLFLRTLDGNGKELRGLREGYRSTINDSASLIIKLSLKIIIHKGGDMKPQWYAIAIVRHSHHERQRGSYYTKDAASYSFSYTPIIVMSGLHLLRLWLLRSLNMNLKLKFQNEKWRTQKSRGV